MIVRRKRWRLYERSAAVDRKRSHGLSDQHVNTLRFHIMRIIFATHRNTTFTNRGLYERKALPGAGAVPQSAIADTATKCY